MAASEHIACMGGFCAQRETCKHYHAEGIARVRPPAERLCTRGMTDQWISLDGHRPSADVSFEVDQRLRQVFGTRTMEAA
jgi:hypothetical protein